MYHIDVVIFNILVLDTISMGQNMENMQNMRNIYQNLDAFRNLVGNIKIVMLSTLPQVIDEISSIKKRFHFYEDNAGVDCF